MCQIQLIHKFDKKNLTKEDLFQFKRLMWLGSHSNDDAYGFYDCNNNVLTKNGKELAKEDLNVLDNISTTTLFGHNRYKTKGDPKFNYNNHPFETTNFVVAHNGVLSNDDTLKKNCELEYTVDTDSYIIPALMEKVYKDTKDVVKTIELVAGVLAGSFSVMVYFKPEKRLFYFKNKSTRMSFALVTTKNGDVVLGSTAIENFNKCYATTSRGYFNKRTYQLDVLNVAEEEIIEFTDKELLMVGTFKETSYYEGNRFKWDTETLTFIKIPETKYTIVKQTHFNDDYYDLDKQKSEIVTLETLAKDKELQEGLEAWYGGVMKYLKDVLTMNVVNSHCNMKGRKLFYLLDKNMGEASRKTFLTDYSWLGEVKFKERKNSKVTEIYIENIHESYLTKEMASGFLDD